MRQIGFALIMSMAAIAGCGPRSDDGPAGRLVVAVSILPHAWVVRQVGGERVSVVTLVKPGESAELYQPSDAQVRRVVRAAVCFSAGMPLENGHALKALEAREGMKVVNLRRGVTLREMVPHAHHEGGEQAAEGNSGRDPHIWLSPTLLKIQARTVAETLSEIDPENRGQYASNLEQLEKELDQADKAIRQTLAPFKGRAFFVFHPAWGYFADDYGLREVAIETEGKQPTDRELAELQEKARAEGTKVIFAPPQSARRTAEAVAEAIGGRVEVLDDLDGDVIENLLKTARLLAESWKK